MDLKLVSARTTRWGAAATAAAAAAAMCVPAVQAQVAIGDSDSVRSPATMTAAGNFSDDKWGDDDADNASRDSSGYNQGDIDPGSLYTVENAIGARGLWAKRDAFGRPLTGRGVTVALLDSGVAQVPGLNGAGKVSYGPDLSIEGNGVLTQKDTYGHGTFMAGIIAGRGTNGSSLDLSTAPANVQLGVAPDAKLLALKLATTDGSTDVTQVIAALDWVTQHPVAPDGTRIRVINLSYGTDSSQAYQSDPLAAAAENAWKHGIVVVTSAGNNGAATGRLTNPGIDPYVIAVGATDNFQNAASSSSSSWSTASPTTVASFSQVGSATRHVDVVAPGTSIVSARAPGSFIDVNNPTGRVSGDTTRTLFRGSGTSQAAAVVSGSVALLLQAYPSLTPDQVKYALTSTADPIRNASVKAAGDGSIDLVQAHAIAGLLTGPGTSSYRSRTLSLQAAVQDFPRSSGQGSINAARGGSFLVDADGDGLTGEIDAQGNPWDPAAWWQASSTGSAWSGGRWLGNTWTGDDWQPLLGGLLSARWSSARWSSARWSDADWSSALWSSARWSSARWSSARWSMFGLADPGGL